MQEPQIRYPLGNSQVRPDPGLGNGQRLISGGFLCPEGLEASAAEGLLRGFLKVAEGFRV